MAILVAYASRHGSTQGIAERIAQGLRDAGREAVALPVHDVGDASQYEAFVIGSAAYAWHWMREASKFVRQNRDLLAQRPVWLFSSGPLGNEPTDAKGHDLRRVSEPREIAQFQVMIKPKDHHVFFGALDFSGLGLTQKWIRWMPAARRAIPEGDFRDWEEVTGWATSIAQDPSLPALATRT